MFLFKLIFASARQEWQEDNKFGAIFLCFFALTLAFGICLCLGLLFNLLGDIFTKFSNNPIMIAGGIILAGAIVLLGLTVEKRSKKLLAHPGLKRPDAQE